MVLGNEWKCKYEKGVESWNGLLAKHLEVVKDGVLELSV